MLEKNILNSLKGANAKEVEDAILGPEDKDYYPIYKDRPIVLDSIYNIQDSPNEIYQNYKNAIERRGREPLDEDRFIYHFFEGGSFDHSFYFGNKDLGYLLGYEKSNIFIPTHFAPKSIRSGYSLIKLLGESEVQPAVLFVTTDLINTISKIDSWKVLNMELPGEFRGYQEDKKLAYNLHPETENRLMTLAAEYIEEWQNKQYFYEQYDEENKDY